MDTNDIERLLQQYGNDQRQQQRAADHVRHLAARQARRRTALACAAVMVLITGVVVHRLQTSPSLSGTLLVEQQKPINTDNTEGIESRKPTPEYPQIQPATLPVNPSIKSSAYLSPYSENHILSETPTSEPYLADLAPSLSPTTPTTIPTDNPPQQPLPDLFPPRTSDPSPYSLEPQTLETLTPTQSHNRLRLSASIGASTMSALDIGFREETTLTNSANSYSTITPSHSLSAAIGMAYTLASNDSRHFDLGVGISGYAQQGNILIHSVGYAESAGFIGYTTNDNIPNITDEHYNINTFSLYASLPLTLSLHPRGDQRIGWQFSLTPAHNISSTRLLGNLSKLYSPNPWRLTLGIGMTLPYKALHHVSLTANLLPLYTASSLHEFGIEVGF